MVGSLNNENSCSYLAALVTCKPFVFQYLQFKHHFLKNQRAADDDNEFYIYKKEEEN
jgi:hypothetical protein